MIFVICLHSANAGLAGPQLSLWAERRLQPHCTLCYISCGTAEMLSGSGSVVNSNLIQSQQLQQITTKLSRAAPPVGSQWLLSLFNLHEKLSTTRISIYSKIKCDRIFNKFDEISVRFWHKNMLIPWQNCLVSNCFHRIVYTGISFGNDWKFRKKTQGLIWSTKM